MRGPQPNILNVYQPSLPHFPCFECVDSPSVVSHAIGFHRIQLVSQFRLRLSFESSRPE
jgi:hypothetical protein